jgi:hypothetical protein
MAKPVSSVSPTSWNQNLGPLPRYVLVYCFRGGRVDFHSSACNCLAEVVNLFLEHPTDQFLSSVFENSATRHNRQS